MILFISTLGSGSGDSDKIDDLMIRIFLRGEGACIRKNG
jgi:hypothetical protein